MILSAEFPEDAPVRDAQDLEAQYRQEVYVYEGRLKQLNEAMQDLESAALEAETLWGSEVEDRMRTVRACRVDLVFLLQDHLRNVRSGHLELRNDRERWKRVHEGISASLGEDDELSVRIRSALQAMLTSAEPHLRR